MSLFAGRPDLLWLQDVLVRSEGSDLTPETPPETI